MEYYLIIAAISILVTSFIAWIIHRASLAKNITAVQTRLQLMDATNTQLLSEKSKLVEEKDLYRDKASQAETRLSESQKYFSQKVEDQKSELEMIGEKFRLEFRHVAQGILDDNSKKLTEQNGTNLKTILDPLKLQLSDFKKQVEDTYDKESKERFSLGKEIEKLVTMSQQVSKEANNLTTALKGNAKMHGNWGEMILESLLENSGLTKDREYFIQSFLRDNAGNTIKDSDGNKLQPDVMIFYPDQRKIIIDSKVSLIAWDSFVACADREDQDKCLQDHIKSLRNHIDGLASKNYAKYAEALDYVLLFIPIEPAFLEAVKTDLKLWKYAYDKKILLVSPTNLFAVLKIIADLWKVEQQNLNAIEIADKAGSLYDKFAGFIDNMEDLGKKLNGANESYQSAFKQLSTGKGNIINKIEELKKMGANASKQLPDRILLPLIEIVEA